MADTLKMILNGIANGLKDSIIGTFKVYHMDKLEQSIQESPRRRAEHVSVLAQRRAERKKPAETKEENSPKVLQRIMLCCAWNGGIFWLSIFLFHGCLLPLLECFTHLLFGDSSMHNVVWSWIVAVLSWTFSTLWVLPLFVLSKIVNSFWFQDIADAAYRKSRGRPLLPSLSKIIADILFSLLLQSLFLVQGMLASLLPIAGLGGAISLLHMCLLYSLYAFEYKWFNMGWEVHRRLSHIESNWAYFFGFGLPLAVLTSLPASYIISGCVFSILFPLFIISANESDPIKYPCDFPLRLFSPVVSVSNAVFHLSIKKTSAPSGIKSGTTPTGTPTHSASR